MKSSRTLLFPLLLALPLSQFAAEEKADSGLAQFAGVDPNEGTTRSTATRTPMLIPYPGRTENYTRAKRTCSGVPGITVSRGGRIWATWWSGTTPGQIIERDLIEDKINLTFVWGPIAGYQARQNKSPELVIVPLKSESGMRVNFQLAMAVRHADQAWRKQVDDFIVRRQNDIDGILDDYGVPRLAVLVRERADDDDDD